MNSAPSESQTAAPGKAVKPQPSAPSLVRRATDESGTAQAFDQIVNSILSQVASVQTGATGISRGAPE